MWINETHIQHFEIWSQIKLSAFVNCKYGICTLPPSPLTSVDFFYRSLSLRTRSHGFLSNTKPDNVDDRICDLQVFHLPSERLRKELMRFSPLDFDVFTLLSPLGRRAATLDIRHLERGARLPCACVWREFKVFSTRVSFSAYIMASVVFCFTARTQTQSIDCNHSE